MSERRAFVRNASDAKQVRRAKETAARRSERENAEMCALLSTTEGLRVMWRILDMCGEHKISYHLGQQSLSDTVFLEGHRNVGNYIKTMIAKADPDAFTRMQKDAMQVEQQITEPLPRSDEPIEDDDGN